MEKQLIGSGNTAEVFEWGKDKVLKLFYEGYPEPAVENEYTKALSVKELDFPKPIPYERLRYKGRSGIVYEKVLGVSLENWFFKTGDLDKCAFMMAALHKRMLEFDLKDLPDYKEFLAYHIHNAERCKIDEKEEALRILQRLPEGNTLCHGDYHPGNILISGTQTYAIDFMNLCRGNYLYDIARTVYLVEYTPVSENATEKEGLLDIKQTLVKKYLGYMGITKDRIKDYLLVIGIARAGECPNEYI
ncbi:aminoglycoside phosphotransferase family protein [Anaerocolumna sp. AGMB13020]|uniref:aminoglycoside phosphotransferase family protein n=1 Tax=Anaerocolumna sp. AGMB13020 TaxID=3081750 RepID=UPI0029545F6C|nr:aminoglycoside phosphotransferase family protein [Anaerocolumna sp. AGMB13020]WOO34787.1 aminoglycoside phosphotransferase family protein [Anaerocolumna sp. AGMB13020]